MKTQITLNSSKSSWAFCGRYRHGENSIRYLPERKGVTICKNESFKCLKVPRDAKKIQITLSDVWFEESRRVRVASDRSWEGDDYRWGSRFGPRVPFSVKTYLRKKFNRVEGTYYIKIDVKERHAKTTKKR